jgi:hypothetical protein
VALQLLWPLPKEARGDPASQAGLDQAQARLDALTAKRATARRQRARGSRPGLRRASVGGAGAWTRGPLTPVPSSGWRYRYGTASGRGPGPLQLQHQPRRASNSRSGFGARWFIIVRCFSRVEPAAAR